MTLLALIAAAPWFAVPLIALWRARGDPSLDDSPLDVLPDPPLVSIIIPARNEASNIAECVQSVQASFYPALEIIVVDDHSDDETGAIARGEAARDARVRVIDAPVLADGWFGKQWACDRGAAESSGTLLCFTDADTFHGQELLTRSVNAMRARSLDFLSVLGRQLMRSFWERMVQPQVFAMLALRFGGARAVNASRRASGKLANGQFLLITRAAYDGIGGHAAVRDLVAEDLGLAQLLFRRGMRTELVDGRRHLATRMYTSLRGIVQGWMKNIYAGARSAAPFGSAGRVLLPLLLMIAPLANIAPPLVLVLGLLGLVSSSALSWAALATAPTLAWWVYIYILARDIPRSRVLGFALGYPLGSAVLAYIIARAVFRGRRVEWRGREYSAR
ncbi:MAG TPA: glycosyltransferase family 2 protein [Gemmatimonadaceae bacterium]